MTVKIEPLIFTINYSLSTINYTLSIIKISLALKARNTNSQKRQSTGQKGQSSWLEIDLNVVEKVYCFVEKGETNNACE